MEVGVEPGSLGFMARSVCLKRGSSNRVRLGWAQGHGTSGSWTRVYPLFALEL